MAGNAPQYTLPYSISGAPNPAYAAPPRGSDPHTPPGEPYAQQLRSGVVGQTPDPMRLNQIPIRDEMPDPRDAPQNFYLGLNGVNRDMIQRHGAETQDGNGWTSPAPMVRQFADNPRWRQYPEARPLNRLNPNTYSFTRPYGQRWAQIQNLGRHFSMADHRREYPIYGMAPAPAWRNTERVTPAPWDTNIVDRGTQTAYAPAPQLPHYEVPMNSQRWVLT